MAGSTLVDAPLDGAAAGYKQRDEAINHCKFTAVPDRESALRLMDHEISHRHFTADDECGQMREQSNQYKHSAHQLNPSPGPAQDIVRLVAAKHTENFGGAVAGKKKTKHDTKHGVRGGFKLLESVHSM